ncbi:MAG TPA: tetratricopeptide repeat protein [Thermoanaerobaculia bacterium]|nr:tetratricopeptide repeat protein [Thermoanaerobaculia bacterium]
MKLHPHDLLLQEFAATFSEDRADCLDHLIRCPRCRKQFRSLLHLQLNPLAENVVPLWRQQPGPVDYEPGLARVSRDLKHLPSAYEKERVEALGLFSELSSYHPSKQSLMVRNFERFHTWGLCELLLQRTLEQNFQNPSLGESFALLALEISDYLADTYYGAEAIEDLRARAWAYVANARRLKADLRGAEEAFALAFACLRRGTLHPMEKAVLLDLQASLLRAQRRFGKSLSLLRRAASIFRKLGEKHRAGRVLINMSTVFYVAGEPKKAIPLIYEALELIDPAREPRLLLSVWHNLIYNLTEIGQFMEAQRLFVRARPLYRQFPEPWAQNRSAWAEGRIARGLGLREQAEDLFLAARAGFLAAKAPYEMAHVSLELASLYAEEGRTAELKQLAEEMMPIFSSRQIHREALAALAFWKQAVETEKAGLELVTGVASFLKRAQHDPELRFERPKES